MSPGKRIIQNELKTLDGKRALQYFYMLQRVFDHVARPSQSGSQVFENLSHKKLQSPKCCDP